MRVQSMKKHKPVEEKCTCFCCTEMERLGYTDEAKFWEDYFAHKEKKQPQQDNRQFPYCHTCKTAGTCEVVDGPMGGTYHNTRKPSQDKPYIGTPTTTSTGTYFPQDKCNCSEEQSIMVKCPIHNPPQDKCTCCGSTPSSQEKGYHCSHCPLSQPPQPHKEEWKEQLKKRFGKTFYVAEYLNQIKSGYCPTHKDMIEFISSLLLTQRNEILDAVEKELSLDKFGGKAWKQLRTKLLSPKEDK